MKPKQWKTRTAVFVGRGQKQVKWGETGMDRGRYVMRRGG